MLDYIQAFFWSATYVMLIIYAIRFKFHGIPLISICLNFSWETNALFHSIQNPSASLAIHISWFLLDLVIVILFLFFEKNNHVNAKKKVMFLIGYICSSICLFFLFKYQLMLLSCFFIDLIMAIDFFVFVSLNYVRRSKLAYFIGFSKLIGDACAWLHYGNYSGQLLEYYVINIIGIIVLTCNTAYIITLWSKK